jgi:hypothetical protein
LASDGGGAAAGDAVPEDVAVFWSPGATGGGLTGWETTGGMEVADVDPLLGPTGTVSRGELTVGGIVAGVSTRSVVGDMRTERSLYPTRKPREKKTPQTATPARKIRRRCRVERPLSSRFVFISLANLDKVRPASSRVQKSDCNFKWQRQIGRESQI